MSTLMISSCPWGEDCAQTLDELYAIRAPLECGVFRSQLQRHYAAHHDGVDPPCRLVVQENPHDFCTYYTVDAVFDDNDEAAVTAAYWLESHTPERWDYIARLELNLPLLDDAN